MGFTLEFLVELYSVIKEILTAGFSMSPSLPIIQGGLALYCLHEDEKGENATMTLPTFSRDPNEVYRNELF